MPGSLRAPAVLRAVCRDRFAAGVDPRRAPQTRRDLRAQKLPRRRAAVPLEPHSAFSEYAGYARLDTLVADDARQQDDCQLRICIQL